MKKLFLLFSLFCFGCATTHPGSRGRSLSPAGDVLKISVDPVKEYSDASNIYLDFTIENTGTRWIKIDQVTVEFPNSAGVVHNVIVGEDLKVWIESLENKKRLDNHNASIGAAALALTGVTVALIGAVRGDKGLATAGLAATAGGYGWQAGREIKTSMNQADRSILIPDNYVLAPMTLPSGGLIRRWLLVNIPQGLIAKNAILTLNSIEGDVLKFEVPIEFKKAQGR